MNGIQEVSGSIPLISTKRNPFPKGSGFFLLPGNFYHSQPQIKLDEVDGKFDVHFTPLLMILIPGLFLAACAVVFAVKKSAEIWQKRLPLWYNEISQYKGVWQ